MNVQVQVKTKNGKNLKVKALVDSRCTHTGIDKQLVKDKRIQTKKIDFSFEVFNADGTKNGEGDQGGASGSRNQQTQRDTGSGRNGLGRNGHVFGTRLVG